MNIPDYGDPIIRLQRAVKELQRQIDALQSSTGRPTVPIYSPQNLADFIEQQEGEFWINKSDGKMYYQFRGVNKITSTP